jgi:hypothetical protein
VSVKLKTIDSPPRRDDETFKEIIDQLEKCDGFMAVSLWKSKEGTLYRSHWMSIGSEELIYACEQTKIKVLKEETQGDE